ncbi:NADPH:quinone oxidoreductase family protein [Chelatococcus reniformis]|uniref:NADPH:quinone oxidoreductase n=1 Tax=Chelatococcus reniformis TaxID=1494448 RepID=A0A916XLF4_9HYPH|nr:NADPH:quinone oxidoreductase family protein [Chelatococcus reniformis]GGC84080.1 NADPH:quinone oxidoreductase [Chelatococcus reniformis]
MRAIHCTAYGDPKDLIVAEIAEPSPEPGDAVVAVEAVGLGFVDGLHVRGGYQVKRPLPFVPGSEIAGRIVAVGPAVRPDLVGQRVMALAERGGLAERALVTAEQCIPLPDGISAVAAASSVVNYSTGIYGLETCGRVQPGETVLVLGASGGVGMAAIDIAKGMGATVVAAASSADKLAACRARGADLLVDYSGPEWRRALEQVLAGRRLDVVYDPVGDRWSETAFRCLAPGGRHLVVGFAGGDIPRIPLNLPLLKRASIVGVDWGGHVRADKGAARPLFERLLELAGQGLISPEPSATYPLEEAPSVIERLLGRANIGKPVIVM